MGSVTDGRISGRIADVRNIEWTALMNRVQDDAGLLDGLGDDVFGEAMRAHLTRLQAAGGGAVDKPTEAVSAFANFAAPR